MVTLQVDSESWRRFLGNQHRKAAVSSLLANGCRQTWIICNQRRMELESNYRVVKQTDRQAELAISGEVAAGADLIARVYLPRKDP